MKIKALLALSLILPSLAMATPSDSSLNKLAEVMPYESVFFDTFIAPIAEERELLAYNLASDSALTDSQRTEALKAFDTYAENMIKTLDTPQTKTDLKTAYLAVAKQHYTQAEVDAQIAFYGSEVGQSALSKQQQVLGDFMNRVAPSGVSKIESYQQTHLVPMQDNIKRILGK